MKKMMVVLAATLLASVSMGQAGGAKATTLASARAKITQVIDNPSEMTALMSGLSADDQKAFLSEVNAAILTMPGDEAERTAKYVAITDAALAGAQKGNALALVAEVFATVPPASLAAVNESLGAGLMNRAADKGVTYTDDQYIKIAQTVMERVNERVANEDNSGVRSGFAALMLIRGSNSASNDAIYDAIVEAMPEASRNDAKVEWFPAALGRDREKSYEPMLALTDGELTNPLDYDVQHMLSIRVPGPMNPIGVLADISGSSTDKSLTPDTINPVVDAIQNPTDYQLPSLGAGAPFDDPHHMVDWVTRRPMSQPEEPIHGYQYQTTR